jgi:Bacterial Ig domain
MMSAGSLRHGPGKTAVILLAVAACLAPACGKSPRNGPQVAEQALAPAAGSPASGIASQGVAKGNAVVAGPGAFKAFVIPAVPTRTMPPRVSLQSAPGQGGEIRSVEWYVGGTKAADGPSLPPERFQRGDRIHAVVKVGAGGQEVELQTPEVAAGDGLPIVSSVRIDPQAPLTGGKVSALAEGADPDGDPIAYRYQWYVDNHPVPGDGKSLSLNGVKRGSWVHVVVTPADGIVEGPTKSSAKYEVVNAPPVVTSPPPTTVPPDRQLRHTIVAEDPDGDPLTYTLVKGPPGMTLSGSTIEWLVEDAYIGTPVEAVVEISDGHGGKTLATLSMTARKN